MLRTCRLNKEQLMNSRFLAYITAGTIDEMGKIEGRRGWRREMQEESRSPIWDALSLRCSVQGRDQNCT